MAKGKKSTRKFVRQHLGTEIAKRRRHSGQKKGSRKVTDELTADVEPSRSDPKGVDTTSPSKRKVEDLDVDELLRGDFLEGDDFDIGKDDEDEGDEESGEDDPLQEEEGEDEEEAGEGNDSAQHVEEESSSDDEAEEGSVKKENQKMQSELKQHKGDLEALKQKDPEFYKFLQEHDKELLDFGGEEEDELEDAVEEDEGKTSGVEEDEEADDKSGKKMLTTAMVDEWCTAAKEKHSPGAVKNLLRAFRSACHYGDGETEDLESPFNIASSHVFNRVMLFTLKEIDGIFKAMLVPGGYQGAKKDVTETNGVKGKIGKSKKGGNVVPEKLEVVAKDIEEFADLEKNSRWKKVEPLVKSYIGNALHILGQMTDADMIGFSLKRLTSSVIFLRPFQKLTRKLLKLVLHFWSSGEGALPLLSLLFVRQLAVKHPAAWLEECLKGIYRAFSSRAAFVNPSSIGRLSFLTTCVAEIYGLDCATSYPLVFVYVRQLAILLRNALTMKSKDAYKTVYCWQFMNCLQLWSRVLAANHDKPDLRPLVYPLTQVISGTARLLPTARYFPLRLMCVRMLNHLAGASGHYIPVAALLLEMFETKELRKSLTGGAGRNIDLRTMLKVPKLVLSTRSYQEQCIDTVMELLAQHLAQWSYSIAFPELALVPLVNLRRFVKEGKVERFRRQAKQLVDQIERNMEFVGRKREDVSFSPKDLSAVATFLESEREAGASPLTKYHASLALRAEQQRTNSVVVGGEERGGSKGGKKRGRNEEEDENSDEEEDEENGEDDKAFDTDVDLGEKQNEGEAVFGKGWMPTKKQKRDEEEGEKKGTKGKKGKAKKKEGGDKAMDEGEEEDVVQDLILSDDEEDDENVENIDFEDNEDEINKKPQSKKGKAGKNGKVRSPHKKSLGNKKRKVSKQGK